MMSRQSMTGLGESSARQKSGCRKCEFDVGVLWDISLRVHGSVLSRAAAIAPVSSNFCHPEEAAVAVTAG